MSQVLTTVGQLKKALQDIPDETKVSGVGFVDQHEASTGDGVVVSWAPSSLAEGPKIHIEHE